MHTTKTEFAKRKVEIELLDNSDAASAGKYGGYGIPGAGAVIGPYRGKSELSYNKSIHESDTISI